MSRLSAGVACVAVALASLGVVSPQGALAGPRVPRQAGNGMAAETSDARGGLGVVRVGGRPTRDVAIWLDVPGARPESSRPTALLDQRHMQFVPRVLAVPVGTTGRMPNSDRLLHNVFSFRDAKVFDLGLYPVGTTKTVTFDKPGLSRIFCNIQDVGEAIRHPGVNRVVRVQATAGDVILGTSYIDTNPYNPRRVARGRARFGGVDARWMRGGVQLRGEWIDGQPFDGTTTHGGYIDAILHTRRMGAVTALARAEKLGYNTTSTRRLFTHRYGGAVRVRVWQQLAVSFGVSHQRGQLTQRRPTAVDVGATWAWRKDVAAEP